MQQEQNFQIQILLIFLQFYQGSIKPGMRIYISLSKKSCTDDIQFLFYFCEHSFFK